jgi:hypothetical protein
MRVGFPEYVNGRQTDDRYRYVHSEGEGGIGKEGRDGEERPGDSRGLKKRE